MCICENCSRKISRGHSRVRCVSCDRLVCKLCISYKERFGGFICVGCEPAITFVEVPDNGQ
jgi:hypothetical protein